MCFQGFAYYACGHNKIFERECELADAHPFWIKIACPNYQSQSATPSCGCGAGGYYCRETREGPLLDGVHETLNHVQVELKQIDARVEKLKSVALAFTTSANQAGISQEVRRRHPAFNNIITSQSQVIQQRRVANQRRMQATATIQYAMAYFQRRAHHISSGSVGIFPAMMLPSAMPPSLQDEVANPLARQTLAPQVPRMPGAVSVTNQAIHVSQDDMPLETRTKRMGLLQDRRSGDNIYVTPRRVAHRIDSPDMHFGNTELQQKEVAASDSPRKKRGRPRRTIEQSDAEQQRNLSGRSPKRPRLPESSSNVRRSARNHDKKVSYAESEASSTRSRNLSPSKSEVSTISPPKSDWTGSPDKSEDTPRKEKRDFKREINELNDIKPSHTSSSLSSMIGDWKKRRGAVMNDSQHKENAEPVEQYAHNMTLGGDRSKGEAVVLPTKNTNQFYSDPVMPSLTALRAYVPLASTQQVQNTGQEMRPPSRRGLPHPTQFTLPHCNNRGLQHPPALPNLGPALPSQISQPNIYNAYAGRSLSSARLNLPYSDGVLATPQYDPNAAQRWSVNLPSFAGQIESPPSLNHEPPYGEMHFGPELPSVRSDSIIGGISIGGEGPQSSMSHAPAVFNYDHMKRSFGAAADLAPAPVIDLTTTNTEPKKRSMPASSPFSSSSKRLRLSFPGDDGTILKEHHDTFPDDITGSMSSPSKIPSQQLRTGAQGDQQSPSGGREDVPATTAPAFAPAAVMYMATQEHEDRGDDGARVTDLPEVFGADEVAEQYVGNEFSDIDWGYVDDDPV